MNETEAAVADLDAALSQYGDPVTLTRITLGPGGAQIPFSVSLNAQVSPYMSHRGGKRGELVPGSEVVIQIAAFAIISPSAIEKANWPGPSGQPATSGVDRRVPKSGDKLTWRGRQYTVTQATPYYVGSDLARIELLLQG